jgi:hypothetical protein
MTDRMTSINPPGDSSHKENLRPGHKKTWAIAQVSLIYQLFFLPSESRLILRRAMMRLMPQERVKLLPILDMRMGHQAHIARKTWHIQVFA